MLDRGTSEVHAEEESAGALQKMQAEVQGAKQDSEPQKCEKSTVYNSIMHQVINTIYDPKILGDLDTLRNKYNCQIKNNDDAIKYADKALEELDDPYTDLFTKTEVAIMKTTRAGEFYGLGMSIKNTDDNPAAKAKNAIGELVPGGAAEMGGLKVNDMIMKIDGEDVSRLSINEVTARIRSEKDLPVSLSVWRDGKEVELKNIQRRKIENKAVAEPEVKDGISHIKISTFNQSDTSIELKAAIEKHPDAKAYIIDLRKNGGGLTSEAFRSLSLFMGEGTLAIERERVNGRDLEEDEVSYYKTHVNLTKDNIEFDKGYEDMPGLKVWAPRFDRHPDIVNKPVVVLVDGGTASASEIFAAALKDNKEATLIGSQTYGKGIGQTVDMTMPEGTGLAVTNLRIYTPNGHWAGDAHKNRIGLKPDVEVKETEDALEVSRQYLKNLLASKEIRKAG